MGKIIRLSKPDLKGSIPLEQAIAARRSRRDFSSRPLTLEQISQLLWSAQGEGQKGFRTAPSAGATYPLDVFVVTEKGLFHYLPGKHSLESIADNDLRSELASAALGQKFIEKAPVTVIFTANFERTTGYYGRRGIRYVFMEAGHSAQNVHLQAEALGLGSVAVGAFDDDSVRAVLKLPGHLEPIYMVVVGYCRD